MSSKNIDDTKKSVRHFYRIPGFSPAFVEATKRKLEEVRTESTRSVNVATAHAASHTTDHGNEKHASHDRVLLQCGDSRHSDVRAGETVVLVVDRDVRARKDGNEDVFEKFQSKFDTDRARSSFEFRNSIFNKCSFDSSIVWYR